MVSPGTPSHARPLFAAAMAAPAVIVAIWIAWFELTLPPPYATPEPGSTLAGAVAEDRIETAFAHIRAGEDPNAPVPYQHPELTGGHDIVVTPLLIAVAHDNTDSVAMLMSSGVRLDAPGNRYAVCLARRLGHDDLADKIIEDAGPEDAPTACPDRTPDEAPLSGYVD